MRELLTLFRNDPLMPSPIFSALEKLGRDPSVLAAQGQVVTGVIESLLEIFKKQVPKTLLPTGLLRRQWAPFARASATQLFDKTKLYFIASLLTQIKATQDAASKSSLNLLLQALTEGLGCDFPADFERNIVAEVAIKFSLAQIHLVSKGDSATSYMAYVFSQKLLNVWSQKYLENHSLYNLSYQFVMKYWREVQRDRKGIYPALSQADSSLLSPRFWADLAAGYGHAEFFMAAVQEFAAHERGESAARACYMAYSLFPSVSAMGLRVKVQAYFEHHFLVVITVPKSAICDEQHYVVDPILNPSQAWYLGEYLAHLALQAPELGAPSEPKEPIFNLTLTTELLALYEAKIAARARLMVSPASDESGIEVSPVGDKRTFSSAVVMFVSHYDSQHHSLKKWSRLEEVSSEKEKEAEALGMDCQ